MQQKEIINVEKAQKEQFKELSEAWDSIMSDYEETANITIDKLKQK